MDEKMKIEKFDDKKYKLPDENIIALDEDSEVRNKFKKLFNSLEKNGVIWPVELQGAGHTDYSTKEFKVRYPVGDIFLSYAITIHELGHLRQGEYDKRFAIKTLGAEKDLVDDDDISNLECDHDAWTRGIERTKKYCPEVLEFLEEKFQSRPDKDVPRDFEDFNDFLKFIVSVARKINILNDKVDFGSKDYIKELTKTIKSDQDLRYFFMEQEKWRTGEEVNKDEIKKFIKKAVLKIADENEDIRKN